MIRLLVATHKAYAMPADGLYLPVQAGAALHPRLPYAGDDTGLSISDKNDQYCELTALYWGWKNLEAEALGLCHYRRLFREPGKRMPLTGETLTALLEEFPAVLPKKRHYWIETGETQFVHAHGNEPLEALRAALRDTAPDYLPAFDRTMARTAGHRFNMLIMRREALDRYCAWLFPLLLETEKRIEHPAPRMMGYLAERLLDAWIETTNTPYTELPLHLTEKTNWLRKGSVFLLRKLRGGTA